MIAKTDLTIMTLASALLIVAIARSETDIRPQAPVVASSYNNAATPPPMSDNMSSNTVTVATNTSTQNANPITAIERAGGDVVSASAETFKEPDVIKDASFRTHVVKNGDVLSRIAVKYNTSVSQLQALNNLRGTVIHVGQELVYPTQ